MEIVRYINKNAVIGAVPNVTVESFVVRALLADLNRQKGATMDAPRAS